MTSFVYRHARCALLAAVVLVSITGVVAGQAPQARPPEEPPAVRCGVDVLARDGFRPLVGRRVGLITNHTGVDQSGRTTLDLLRAAPGVTLVALFSPEHGLLGTKDEKIGHGTDPNTGLRIWSLYGETKRPTAEMLEGIDTLVYDIQDIGTRFYTYIATLGYAMEEAAPRDIRVVVLDRPNPITGTRVFGPLSERAGEFTSYDRLPLVHGMTVGELAKMFNAERNLGVDLVVVHMEGWKRRMWWDETGLTWINPSPNMRSLTQATLYSAVGLVEACTVSVGRGTDTPFERLGAPWLDGRRLAARLNTRNLPGVRFVPFTFTPQSSKHAGKLCGGVQVLLLDRERFDPLETGLAIAAELESLHPESFDYENVDKLLMHKAVLRVATQPADAADPSRARWRADLEAFLAVRAKYLLYE